MGPWDALGRFLADLVAQRKIQQWYALLFSMGFSGLVSFLTVAGTSLTAGKTWPVAVGAGMIASAGTLVFLYVRSPLTKGIMVAVPKEAIVRGESEGLATIQPKK